GGSALREGRVRGAHLILGQPQRAHQAGRLRPRHCAATVLRRLRGVARIARQLAGSVGVEPVGRRHELLRIPRDARLAGVSRARATRGRAGSGLAARHERARRAQVLRASRALAPRLTLEAARHEFLALAVLQLLLGRLLVARGHALLLSLLRRRRLGLAAAQARAHELLALVALLVAGLGVAVLHALLLRLLLGARLFLRILLVLRKRSSGCKRKAQRGDQQFHFA